MAAGELVYLEHTPAEPLRRFVRCLWVLESSPGGGPPAADRVLPDGCVEIVLHYGAPFQRVARSGATAVTQHRDAVVGQIAEAMALRPCGPVGILGVRFAPAGAGPMLRLPQHRLASESVPLADVWGATGRALADAVRDADTPAARIRAAERVLTPAACAAPRRRTMAEEAVAALLAARGGLAIATVAAELGSGVRTLERRFRDDVGLTPKAFARVVRLQHAVGRLRAAPRTPLVDVALAAGYADQPHFTREFREIVGEPPARWVRGEHALADTFVAHAVR